MDTYSSLRQWDTNQIKCIEGAGIRSPRHVKYRRRVIAWAEGELASRQWFDYCDESMAYYKKIGCTTRFAMLQSAVDKLVDEYYDMQHDKQLRTDTYIAVL